jgi:primosomal protein N' (replication factor Y)
MKIITVIPLKKGLVRSDLTYFTGLNVSLGNVVSVPIRSKLTLALVTSAVELKDAKSSVRGMNFNLRKVAENKGESVFQTQVLEAIFDTGKYFAQNKNIAVASLIPGIFIENYDMIAKSENVEKSSLENKQRNRQNIRAEKLLLQYPLPDRISVYKTLIRESFAKGKSVFMVMPTELDIEKFGGQLSKGIEQFTFSLHSGISVKKNLLNYEKIVTSPHPVFIIGTAPFLSIPRIDIGTIILEHENSNAYRMIRRPHFDLRVFTEIYASKINAKFIMADELLRFETAGRIDVDNLHPMHPLSFRIDFEGMIEILGKNKKPDNGSNEGKKFKIFSDQTLAEIKSCIESKKNVFIFTLRKGLATMTVCKDCGEIVACSKCGSPLVLYLSFQNKKRMFVCNRCAEEKGPDIACASCRSWNLMPLGIGTDTVYEEIKKIFPKTKIFQIDKESAKTTAGAKKIIKEYEESEGSVLIGTEMAFFYLKKKARLSVIASFDSLWSIPSYKISEKIIQIALSMVNITTAKFVIQTRNENDPAILAIKSGNLLPFVREELSEREKLNYPPFKRFIKIAHLGDKEQTAKAKRLLKEMFENYSPVIFSGFITRLKSKYVTNALIKLEPKNWSLPEISTASVLDNTLLQKLLSLAATFEVFVDPEDLL